MVQEPLQAGADVTRQNNQSQESTRWPLSSPTVLTQWHLGASEQWARAPETALPARPGCQHDSSSDCAFNGEARDRGTVTLPRVGAGQWPSAPPPPHPGLSAGKATRTLISVSGIGILIALMEQHRAAQRGSRPIRMAIVESLCRAQVFLGAPPRWVPRGRWRAPGRGQASALWRQEQARQC